MCCQVYEAFTLIDDIQGATLIYTSQGLSFAIYLTSHFPKHPLTKLALFCFSAIGGSHMVYCVNRQSYLQGQGHFSYLVCYFVDIEHSDPPVSSFGHIMDLVHRTNGSARSGCKSCLCFRLYKI